MRARSTVIERCTAQLKNGEFCDVRSMIDVPFPICRRHAEQLILHLTGETIEGRALRLLVQEQTRSDEAKAEFASAEAVRDRRHTEQSLVYYVRIGDRVKIGYTTNMRARLPGLRIDETAILATEPGGRELEAQRHEEFHAERIGRREDFNPSRRLLAHIERVVEENGPPIVTSYRSGFERDIVKTRPARRADTRSDI
jgi:hypothetical protein